MRRWAFLYIGIAALASAQSFQGIDMRKKQAPAPVVVPTSPDFADGDPIIAMPSRTPAGKVDVEAFKVLYAALKERLGKRLAVEADTVKMADALDATTAATPDGQLKLAVALNATMFVVLAHGKAGMTASLLLKPGATPVAEATVELAAGARMTQPVARRLVADLLKRGSTFLQPPLGVDLTPEATAPEPAPPPPEEFEDVAASVAAAKVRPPEPPYTASPVSLFAGMGASFRSLTAYSTVPIVPKAPGAMAALAFDLSIFPLKFLPGLADSKLSELGLEGYYRYDLVRGQSDVDGVTSNCAALDDELRAQIFYRYPLGGRLPKIGAGVGLAQERTRFACNQTPALNTTFGSTEIQLKILQPIIGERLTLEVSGGPRILYTARAAGYRTQAWSLEGWAVGRVTRHVALRLGARFTSTRQTSWPEGVTLIDERTFVGLEVGGQF